MDDRMKQAVKSTVHAIGKEAGGSGGEHATPGIVDLTATESILADWTDIPQKAARTTIERYGFGTRSDCGDTSKKNTN